MKQGRSLQEVLQELVRQETVKKDFIAPAKHIVLADDAQTIQLNNEKYIETLGTTDLFHKQIAASLNIPGKYYDVMREEAPELLATNVNTWLQSDKFNKDYMVRTIDYGQGQVARAMLSSRYRRIDNLQIAKEVLPLFAGDPSYEVVSSEVTENKLYLKILNKRLEMEVSPGDYVQAGVVISNSEVGLGAVSVQPLVYRLVCTNGMVVNDFGQRRAHIGRASKATEDSFVIYADDTILAEDKAFMLKLRDTVRAAIEEARFRQIVGKLQDSMNNKITGRVQDVVELTSRAFAFNQTESDDILHHLLVGGDLSQWGVANAVTRASQDVSNYDRATQLESAGWGIVTMPAKEWRRINEEEPTKVRRTAKSQEQATLFGAF